MKIAFISRHPAPYRDPLLTRLCKDSRVAFDVYNEESYDSGHRYWSLGKQEYPSMQLYPCGHGFIRRVWYLIRRLVFNDYDLVVWSGFYSSCQVLAMVLSVIFFRKYGFMADTVEQKSIGFLSKLLKSVIVKHAKLVFVPGEAGKKFWTDVYGVPDKRIIKGVYALDNKKLQSEIELLRFDRSRIRGRYGIADNEKVFLMVANMIPSRHYPITTRGFIGFAKHHEDCRLIIVGSGPEYELMKRMSNDHAEIIVVPGCTFDEMKSLYAIADVYVHGGKEPASTALVIGAIAGLPIVTSDAVGCSLDVLEDGRNGVKVADYLSADSWQYAFERIYKCSEHWVEYGECSVRLASVLDVDVVTDAFVQKLLAK